MRKVIIAIIMFCTNVALAQWNLIPCSSTINLSSVHFANGNIGYAVGNGGILKTTDQGNNWTVQTYNGDKFLFPSVHCSSSDTVFIATSLGILRSYDAGNTWNFILGGVYQPTCIFSKSKFVYTVGCFIAQQFPNTHYPWEQTPMSAISKYNGDSMRDLNVCFNYEWSNPLNAIFFLDTVVGYSCGNKTISKTIDGGKTWTCLNNYKGNSIHFVNNNVGYVAGDSGVIRKTIDGGLTWTIQNTGTFNSLTSIYFATPDTGCAVGYTGKILGTIDGGANWYTQYSPTLADLKSVYFTDRNNGYIVGTNGTILKNTSGPVGLKELSKSNLEFAFFPNPTSESINVKCSVPNGILILFDITGNEIKKTTFNKSEFNLNVKDIDPGLYIIKLYFGNTVVVKRLIKE